MTGPASVPHATFDELAAAGADAVPCPCWYAGHGEIRGVAVTDCLHPEEFRDGVGARMEQAVNA